TRASWVKTWDATKALELQEAAYKLAKEFGSPQRTAEAMADMGRISEVLGEYNLALECYQSSLETFESPEMELYRELIDSPSFCMSRTYCELGDGMSGLEWIDSLINLLGPKADEHPYLYGQRAEALVLLDRLDEAAKQLETCQRLSLKSGDEGYMSLYDLPMAYLEIAEGEPITAIGRLEPGYKFYTTAPAAIYINRFLIALARAEIATNLREIEPDVSEQWLSKLGRHAREKNLPGIFMLHALLKADYLIARGLRSEAIETLSEAVLDEHSDTSNTLYQRIVNKIEDLEVH
ncbi:MAG: tetratricopeptide repeat protein, partial [Promethearchaeota archaeon]